MAAGDAQRAWFPEMLEKLKIMWNSDLPWEKRIIICDDMNIFRKKIWVERGIKPIKTWCPNSKEHHDRRPPAIGIRSMLFALKRIDCIQEDEF